MSFTRRKKGSSPRGVSNSTCCCRVSAENAAPNRDRASASSAFIPLRKRSASCGLAARRRSIVAGTPASAAPGVSVRGMIASASAVRHSSSAAVRKIGCPWAGDGAAKAAIVTSTSRLVGFIFRYLTRTKGGHEGGRERRSLLRPIQDPPGVAAIQALQNRSRKFQAIIAPPDTARHELIGRLKQPPPSLIHAGLAPHIGAEQYPAAITAKEFRCIARGPPDFIIARRNIHIEIGQFVQRGAQGGEIVALVPEVAGDEP